MQRPLRRTVDAIARTAEPLDPNPKARLSILVPLHNESAGVAALAERMRTYMTSEMQRPAELILIDDGSTDDTYDLLREHFTSAPQDTSMPCKILRHDHNLGERGETTVVVDTRTVPTQPWGAIR